MNNNYYLVDFDTRWDVYGRGYRFRRAVEESRAIGASILAGDTKRDYYTLDFRRQPERYVADEPVPLKEGYQFLCRQVDGEGYWYVVLDPQGAVVASGVTDDSGRGDRWEN